MQFVAIEDDPPRMISTRENNREGIQNCGMVSSLRMMLTSESTKELKIVELFILRM